MSRAYYLKTFSKLIFISALILLCSNSISQAATSPDAVGMRVMKNDDHLSPWRWYQNNIKDKGSPQALIVNGYEAVRDGRTVYVNAANIVYNEDRDEDVLYTNIYIISYNQAAEDATIDIFGQILNHWKFNTNVKFPHRCMRISDGVIQEQKCLEIDDCPSGQYCLSGKARIVRDTKRLADLTDIKLALAKYQENHNGSYPELSAGSYLAGKSISTWPSWRGTLGQALGITMPADPINKLRGCIPPYDSVTCWDQEHKKFDGTTRPDGSLILRSSSRGYIYTIKDNSYKLCAIMESGLVNDLNACAGSELGFVETGSFPDVNIICGQLEGYQGKNFSGFVSASYTGSDALAWSIINKGGIADLALQNTAATNQKKLSSSPLNNANYTIRIRAQNSTNDKSDEENCDIAVGRCGDNKIQADFGENCDDGNIINGDGCNSNCRDESTLTYCGDGIVDNNGNDEGVIEQCDDGNTDNNDGCDENCRIVVIQCGNGVKETGEQCDGDDGVGPHQDCTDSCTLVNLSYCGDGTKQSPNTEHLKGLQVAGVWGYEECDGSSGVGAHQACSADCTIINRCPDGTKDADEECDDGDQIETNNCLNDCTEAKCGDRHVRSTILRGLPPEQCDNGGNNGSPCTAGYGETCQYCDSNCQIQTITGPRCGDNTVNHPSEECDGPDGLPDVHHSCTADCRLNHIPYCGDGQVNQASEQCDDGNTSNEDDCLNNCQSASCGDGFINKNGTIRPEVCDKANPADNCTGTLTGLPGYCANPPIQGTKTCKNDCSGYDACVIPPPQIIGGGSNRNCAPESYIITDKACCKLIDCFQDGCGCCGCNNCNRDATSGAYITEAPYLSGYDSMATMNVAWNSSYISVSPGCLSGRVYTNSSGSAASYYCDGCGPAYKVLGGANMNVPANQCRLNRSSSDSRSWYVTTNHASAKFECWK